VAKISRLTQNPFRFASKYVSRVLLATAIRLVCIAILMKKSGYNDKLLSTEATFGFFALLTFLFYPDKLRHANVQVSG